MGKFKDFVFNESAPMGKEKIYLTIKTSPNKNDLIETIVKRDKKLEAKISHPNKYSKEFTIIMNTLAFYRPTLESAIEYVRKSVEDKMNAFADRFVVEIKK